MLCLFVSKNSTDNFASIDLTQPQTHWTDPLSPALHTANQTANSFHLRPSSEGGERRKSLDSERGDERERESERDTDSMRERRDEKRERQEKKIHRFKEKGWAKEERENEVRHREREAESEEIRISNKKLIFFITL